uniref:Uncharacterized protein n=1 Tax=Mycena chlorophos TaxID=658473 RepID=A0ABQ0LRY1_MYCCL|nr:predicted protein [Mycena chlorophos]
MVQSNTLRAVSRSLHRASDPRITTPTTASQTASHTTTSHTTTSQATTSQTTTSQTAASPTTASQTTSQTTAASQMASQTASPTTALQTASIRRNLTSDGLANDNLANDGLSNDGLANDSLANVANDPGDSAAPPHTRNFGPRPALHDGEVSYPPPFTSRSQPHIVSAHATPQYVPGQSDITEEDGWDAEDTLKIITDDWVSLFTETILGTHNRQCPQLAK